VSTTPAVEGLAKRLASDRVAALRAQWGQQWPELDTTAMGVVARVYRLFRYFDREIENHLGKYGLNRGEFDVLASLRRAGAESRLSPSELSQALLLSAQAMTNRLDRLERAGLIKRTPDARDRRGLRLELTPVGLSLIEWGVADVMAKVTELLGDLDVVQVEALAGLLQTLLLFFEERRME
jgi:DNA-binding MarR family transcriptional regulator